MKKLFTIITFVMLAAAGAFAQIQPNLTTLSSALATGSKTIVVASATGFLPNDILIINHEAIQLPSTYSSGTTIQNTVRGTNGTLDQGHVSGATVMRFAPTNVLFSERLGSCTRASQPILPVVSLSRNLHDVTMFDCNGGLWIRVTLPDDVPDIPLTTCNIPIGSVAYASVGTNTTDITDKMMRTSIFVPYTNVFTGIQVLQGGTATTDNITTALFDSGGKLIASSAAAGTLLATANTFKSIAFALNPVAAAQTLTIVPGPAIYWIGVTGSGTTAGAYQTIPTLTFKNVLTGSATSQTFGTFPNFTPATTFTADVGPVVCLYN